MRRFRIETEAARVGKERAIMRPFRRKSKRKPGIGY